MKISILLIRPEFKSESFANNWFNEQILDEKDCGDYCIKLKQLLDTESGKPIGEPTEYYYSKDGGYIGDKKWFDMLYNKYGILPERASPEHNVCSIGYSKTLNKHFGWSHRAINGFSIGDKIRFGDCAYLPKADPIEILKSVQNFWDGDDCIVELDGDYINRWHPDYKKLRAKYGDDFYYKWQPLDWIKAFGTCNVKQIWPVLKERGYMECERTPISEYKTGRGEYTIQTEAEAKQAARNFAESVSKSENTD